MTPAEGPPKHPEYSYTYNKYGNHETITDPKGRVTEFRYDHYGRQIARIMPERFAGDQQARTETSHYNKLGQLVYKLDFEGNLTEMVYDARGRTVRVNKYLAADIGITPANVIGKSADDVRASLVGVPDPAEHIEFAYDALGRQTTVTEHKRTVNTTTKTVDLDLTAFVTEVCVQPTTGCGGGEGVPSLTEP